MQTAQRLIITLFVALLTVTLAIGASVAAAQVPEATPETEESAPERPPARQEQAHPHRGPGHHTAARDEFLAEALGITVEELDAAQERARSAAIEQAVDNGDLTREQADALLDGARAPRLRAFLLGRGGLGWQALLADALGISVDALREAQAEAQAARLAQAVDEGALTQEQADLIAARWALREYLDEQAIRAAALGMSVDEYEAAREAGQRMDELIEAQSLDPEDVREAIEAGYVEAIRQAVTEGVITEEQAEQLLNDRFGASWRHGPFDGPRGSGRGRGVGPRGGIRLEPGESA